jgi:DNA-binding beta-propeller fold protein YncE
MSEKTLRNILGSFAALLLAGCDSGSALAPETPTARTVVFQRVIEREVSDVGYPSGLAVTPDGRWLVSLGFSTGTVALYDATTLERVVGPYHYLLTADSDSVQLGHTHAVVVSPDGSFAVLTSSTGVLGLSLPSLEVLFHPPIPIIDPPRHVVRDRAGENYYVSSASRGIARLTAAGEPRAFFGDAFITTAMALTRDDRELLVVTENGGRLLVLGTPDLQPRLSIDLPGEFEGQVVVPLQQNDRAILVGGARGAGETSADTPLMALPVDLATGLVGSLQVLCCEVPGGLDFSFADGNKWADAGEATAIVPTAVGTVTIDTNLGTVTLHPATELQNDEPPCCDIASYPSKDRVVMANAQSVGGGGFPGGSLVVYEVEERTESTPN